MFRMSDLRRHYSGTIGSRGVESLAFVDLSLKTEFMKKRAIGAADLDVRLKIACFEILLIIVSFYFIFFFNFYFWLPVKATKSTTREASEINNIL